MILTNFKDVLTTIFETTKGKFSKNNDRRGLMEEDFVQMMQEHGFFNDKLTIRYAYMCFHIALSTRVDEITGYSHMQASFTEFIEAFARVCDLSDSTELEKDIFKGYSNEDVPLDKKLELALANFSYLKARRSRISYR